MIAHCGADGLSVAAAKSFDNSDVFAQYSFTVGNTAAVEDLDYALMIAKPVVGLDHERIGRKADEDNVKALVHRNEMPVVLNRAASVDVGQRLVYLCQLPDYVGVRSLQTT